MPTPSDFRVLPAAVPPGAAGAAGAADPVRSVPPLHPYAGRSPANAVLALVVALELADDATLTVLVDGSPTAPAPDAAGFGVGATADLLQIRHCEGPCLTAASTGQLTTVRDMTTEVRWPGWTADARSLGIGSMLSVPLPGSRLLGALNLWTLSITTFTDADTDRACDLAALAADLLRADAAQHNLHRAIEGRTLIGQAQGILIERYRLTPAAAFTTLSTYSRQHNRKISSLAQELVHTGQLRHLNGPAPVG